MIFPWVQLRSQALIRSRFAGLKLWGATSAASRRGLRGKGWPFFCFHKQHVQWDGGVYEGKLYNIVYPYIYILYMLGNVRMKTSVIIEISYNDGFFGGLDDYTNQTHLCWRNLHLILMLVNKYRCLGSSGWALGLILKKSSTLQIPKFQVIICFFWCQASDYVYIVQAVKPCTVFVFSRDRSSKLFEPRIFFSGRFQGKIGPHQKILFLLVFKRPGCWLKSFLGCFGILFLDVFGQHRNSWQKQRKSAQTWRRRFELPLANWFLGYFRMANGNWCWIFHTVCHAYVISNIDCLTVWYTCVDLCHVYRVRVDILSIP